MNLDLDNALFWTQVILSGGIVLQSLEALTTGAGVPGAPRFGAVWFRKPNADEFNLAPRAQPPLWIALSGMRTVHVLRLLIILGLALSELGPWLGAPAPWLGGLLASSLFLAARLRGPMCGGSDNMLFQVQIGLFIAAYGAQEQAEPLMKAGLAWIAAQSVLSYWLAGLAKIKTSRWRDGAALAALLASDGPYAVWRRVRWVADAKVLRRVLGWGIFLFELLFPLVLFLPPSWKWVFLSLGLSFHLSTAAVLGLNRFIWAWAATYPALLYS